MAPASTRAWAEIDLRALHANLGAVRKSAPGAEVLAVVKANAYGHGLTRVCQSLASDVSYFGVAAISEASVIDKALSGQSAPHILLMGATLAEELPEAIERGWHLSISTLAECQSISAVARRLRTPAQVHLVVDTGMGRLGALEKDYLALCRAASKDTSLVTRGLSTHLSSADEDPPFTVSQLARFDAILAEALSIWPQSACPRIHALNSAGICRFGHHDSSTLVRPGLMLYGCAPEALYQSDLIPVMAVKSRIRLLRDLPAGHPISYGHTYTTPHLMRVATISIGYGDGIPRNLSNRDANVLIQGTRCPIIGRITMDQLMVDVTALTQRPAVGDEVVLIGSQADSTLSVEEMARRAETIPWEIFTRITDRVCRIYQE